MTVASETSKVKYNGNDSTTIFAYTYKITDEEQLQVIIADSDDLVPDNSYTLILNTDYTVSDVGEAAGGNVTLDDLTTYCGQATLPTGWVISIARVVEVVQETDFENQGGFFADTHEDAFDYQTFINQQQKEELDRCVKVGITSDTDPDDLLDEIETAKDEAAASAVAKVA